MTGNYILDKSKNSSYNIILKIYENKTYSLQSISTSASGVTKGNWKMKDLVLTLLPEKSLVWKDTLEGKIVDVENYRPFADTIDFKIKKKKLIGISSYNNQLILHKIK